jgi:hypothetical protein
MLRLRRLDSRGLAEFADELRPRFVTLRLQTPKINVRWGMPLWAVEEILGFAVRLVLLAPYALPFLSETTRRRLADKAVLPEAQQAPLLLLDELFSNRGRELLKLPPGEVFVSIQTAGTTIEIGQA